MISRSKVLMLARVSFLAVLGSRASASVIPISAGSFPLGSTLITFTGLADGTEVNGLIVNGVQFSYSAGNGNVVIDGGPGITNNISPPNIVSIGNSAGTLTLLLPGLENMFGYGFAVLSTVPVANATTISLFSGATAVGSLSYNGVPDPSFAGGFAGIQSTILFDRVQLTFNSVAAPAFALDNVRFANAVVPEPTTMLLVGTALVGLGITTRRRRSTKPRLDE